MTQTALLVILEEDTPHLSDAEVEAAGRCPHFGLIITYLEKVATQPDVRSFHGAVALTKQHARGSDASELDRWIVDYNHAADHLFAAARASQKKHTPDRACWLGK